MIKDSHNAEGDLASTGPRLHAGGLILGVLTVAAVLAIGQPALNAPWILGDEYIFIANNPDVTGVEQSTPTGNRVIDIFLHTHEDLYQPVTILSYALQWSPDGGDGHVRRIRLTDVIIHAVNALLLWAALNAILARFAPGTRGRFMYLSWALSFVWAIHPMLVSAFAADMGRTHLLAATFVLLSLLCHLKHLKERGEGERGAWGWFVSAFVLMLIAMLNKPVVGWVLIIFAIEWRLIGLKATLKSPRIYLIGITCACFAALTLWTTRESFALDESALPIFGDPVSRAALGLWIYLRNFAAPLHWLSPWYPPDINTGWGHPAVIGGTCFVVAGTAAAIWAARRSRWSGAAAGLVWFAATWAPISGLVGARVLAAQDRYMYLPIAGLLLTLGVVLQQWLEKKPEGARMRNGILVGAAIIIACASYQWDRVICQTSRSSLKRAEMTAARYPGDPRVIEFLAATYDFCRDHDIPEGRPEDPHHYAHLAAEAMRKSSEIAEQHPEFFPYDQSRAEYHRRLSFNFWRLNLYEDSLKQALAALKYEPEAPMTWVRLAHACRALGRLDETLAAYKKLYEIVKADAPDRGLRLVEYADLALNRFNDPEQALPLYREALACGNLSREALRAAMLGAARCEVLVGKGSDGFHLAMQIFEAEPGNLDAAKIVAQYYLRSHEWEKAERAYSGILTLYPTDYDALRGFQNVCLNNGAWIEAAFAWQNAYEREPDNPIYRAHFIWSAACAGEAEAGEWADKLLSEDADNRMACLARMLIALRNGDVEGACNWIERSRKGKPSPLALEWIRAEATLRKMIERGELPAEAQIARAALWHLLQDDERARDTLTQYLEEHPDSSWTGLVEKLIPAE